MTKTCKTCNEEFELRPGKPGFANICEDCTGLHRNTPLPKVTPQPPAKPAKSQNIWSAAQDLLRAVEAIEGRPDPALRALIQPLKSFKR